MIRRLLKSRCARATVKLVALIVPIIFLMLFFGNSSWSAPVGQSTEVNFSERVSLSVDQDALQINVSWEDKWFVFEYAAVSGETHYTYTEVKELFPNIRGNIITEDRIDHWKYAINITNLTQIQADSIDYVVIKGIKKSGFAFPGDVEKYNDTTLKVGNVIFGFSDLVESGYDIALNKTNAEIRIYNVTGLTDFVLDPVVGPATTTDAIGVPSSARVLVRDSSGQLHAVWRADKDGVDNIYYSNSSDGTTWGTNETINKSTGTQAYPSMVIDSTDRLHVLFSSGSQGWYVNSSDNGTTWGIAVFPVGVTTQGLSLEIDSNDDLHMAGSSGGTLVYSNSSATDNYDSWLTYVTLYTGSSIQYPSIIRDGNDRLHVFAQAKPVAGSQFRILYNSSDDGLTWNGSFITPNNSYANAYEIPHVVVDSSDNLHLFLRNTSNEGIYYTNSSDDGASWGTLMKINEISSTSTTKNHISATVDSRDFIHVVWTESNATVGKQIIMSSNSKDGGLTWLYQTVRQTDSGYNQNKATLRWSSNPSSNSNLNYSSSGTNSINYLFVNGSSSPYDIVYDYLSDTIEPTVKLNFPTNLSINNTFHTNQMFFGFTPQDNEDLVNATLWINLSGTWQFNNSNASALTNNTLATIQSDNIANGTYIWNINVSDSTGNWQMNESNFTLTIDTEDPTVTLTSPDDKSINSTSLVTFYFTPQDTYTYLTNATIWHNASGTWGFNNSNTSALVNATEEGISVQFDVNGTIIWNVNVTDGAYNWQMASANRTLTIDTEDPSVTLISPDTDAWNDTRTMSFRFKPQDTYTYLTNATIWHNASGTWSFNNSNSSALVNNTEEAIDVQFDADGTIIWNVNVTDAAYNWQMNESNFTLTIDTEDPTVTLISPDTDAWNDTRTMTFRFKPQDTYTYLTNATIWHNASGTWGFNNSNTSAISNNTEMGIDVQFSIDGTIIWNVNVTDGAYNWQMASANRTVNIDTTAPTITIDVPTNTTYTTSQISLEVDITEINIDTVNFTNSSGDTATTFDDSVILYLPFDNITAIGENSTIAVDISKYGNNGSIIGPNHTDGKFGYGLNFTDDDYVKVDPFTYANISAVSFWFKTNDLASYADILGCSNTGVVNNIEMELRLDDLTIKAETFNSTRTTIQEDISSDTWYHWAWTKANGTVIEHYINGVWVKNFTGDDLNTGIIQCAIGSSYTYGTAFFNGTIDDVIIYNRSLSSARINQIYNEQLRMNKTAENDYHIYGNITEAEGSHSYTVGVNDSAGNILTSTTYFSVDATAPDVSLVSPDDNSFNNTKLVTFRFTPQDSFSDLINATVWLNLSGTWGFNNSNTSALVNYTEEAITVQFDADGTYIWNVNITDAVGNWDMATANRTINIDTVIPEGALISPEPSAINDTRLMTFHYNATDEFRIVNATLWTNITGTWAFNNSNTSEVTNNTDLSITVQFDRDGLIEWNVLVTDAAGNVGHMSVAANQTVLIDTAAPTVTVSSPDDGGWNTSWIVAFHYKPVETFDITNATLWTNKSGTWDYNNSNASVVANNSDNSISVQFDADGSYLWNIYVNDSAGNAGTSTANRTLYLDTVDPVLTNPVANDTNIDDTMNVSITFTLVEVNWNQTWCWIDGGANYSGSSSECSVLLGGTEGNHTVHIFVNDTADRKLENNDVWVIVDITQPDVVLWSPTDASTNRSNDITFQYFVNDSGSIASAAIYTNASGSWAQNRSNVTPVTNGTMNDIDLADLHDGNLSWNIYVCDGSGNCEYAVIGNWSVNVKVNQEGPRYNNTEAKSPSGNVEVDTAQQFTINVSDNKAVDTVLLQHGTSTSKTNYTMSNDSTLEFEYNLTLDTVDTYHYKFYMNDTTGNLNDTSETSYSTTSRAEVGGGAGGGSGGRRWGCGDGVCQYYEDYSTCPADCEAKGEYSVIEPEPVIVTKSGTLYSDSIKIKSNQSEAIKLKLSLACSDGIVLDRSCEWASILKEFEEIIVEGYESIEVPYKINIPIDAEDGEYNFFVLLKDADYLKTTQIPFSVRVSGTKLFGELPVPFDILQGEAFELPKPCLRYENQTINGTVQLVCVQGLSVQWWHIGAMIGGVIVVLFLLKLFGWAFQPPVKTKVKQYQG